jgi:hypothetical protein
MEDMRRESEIMGLHNALIWFVANTYLFIPLALKKENKKSV